MSGIELLETLKRDGLAVRFGFITSDESEQNRARASAAGARFVIGKPFTRASLRLAVNEATAEFEPELGDGGAGSFPHGEKEEERNFP